MSPFIDSCCVVRALRIPVTNPVPFSRSSSMTGGILRSVVKPAIEAVWLTDRTMENPTSDDV